MSSASPWDFVCIWESYVYWGSVTGFHPDRRSSVPSITAQDVAVGDFNGDGDLDLAFANHNSQVQNGFVYWGDGEGRFVPERRQVSIAKTSTWRKA